MSDNTTSALIGSPLCDFLSRERPKYANTLDSIEIECADFILYVLWVIDTLRDPDKRAQFLTVPWDNTRYGIRSHLKKKGFLKGKEDIDTLAKAVCGHALFCWGFVLTDQASEASANREALMDFTHNLDSHWKEICGIMNSLHYEHIPELRRWMNDYVNGVIFYTVSDEIDWDTETTGLLPASVPAILNHPANINVSIGTFNNYPGATFNDNSRKIVNHGSDKYLQ